MKTCTKCKLELPTSSFNKRSCTADGLNPRCGACNSADSVAYYFANHEKAKKQRRDAYQKHAGKWKDTTIRRMYGISLQRFNEMFVAQSGRCAICEAHQSDLKRSLVIDHDHSTNQVRGLLCHSCNRGLGLLRDSVEIVGRAAAYLRNAKTNLGEE